MWSATGNDKRIEDKDHREVILDMGRVGGPAVGGAGHAEFTSFSGGAEDRLKYPPVSVRAPVVQEPINPAGQLTGHQQQQPRSPIWPDKPEPGSEGMEGPCWCLLQSTYGPECHFRVPCNYYWHSGGFLSLVASLCCFVCGWTGSIFAGRAITAAGVYGDAEKAHRSSRYSFLCSLLAITGGLILISFFMVIAFLCPDTYDYPFKLTC